MRYRWVILAAGTLAQSSFSAVSVGLPALAPALRSHYRLSLGETGVVLGAVGIGMLVALLPWGLLADRVGERFVMASGLLGAAIAVAAAAETHSFWALVGVLVVAGALGSSVNAASGRAVMGWFGAHERGLALGIRQTAIPIGGAAAAAGLPWLAAVGGTRLAFLVLGCSCATGALVAAAFMREAPSRTQEIGDVTGPLRDGRMWFLAGGSALYLDEPDRDHRLRRPLPARPPARLDRRGCSRARGDQCARDRRAHRRRPLVRPRRLAARAAAPDRGPARGCNRARGRGRRCAARRARAGARSRGGARPRVERALLRSRGRGLGLAEAAPRSASSRRSSA